ncbi:protein of unknown function [Rhodovastum atsumiense]|nr:protein of unknown function [Rhodovastum atsumiense]
MLPQIYIGVKGLFGPLAGGLSRTSGVVDGAAA